MHESVLSLARPTLFGLLLAAAACGGPGPGDSPHGEPNVLIVVIDCLRADHVAAYGYPRETTPTLDALAARGVLFERAITQANWTRPSVASLLSGLYVGQHRVPGDDESQSQVAATLRNRILHGNRLSAGFTTLAEALRHAGYATGAFIHQAQMPPEMQFDQGFDIYDAERKGDHDVVVRFADWAARQERFFAYLHLLDLHFPYIPRPRHDVFRTTHELLPERDRSEAARRALGRQRDPSEDQLREIIDLYDGAILGLDERLGEILHVLEQNGIADDTLVVVTSDHGEAFREHGYMFHGGDNLHEEVLRVPLVLAWPARIPAGLTIAGPVQLVDVLPTVLELVGIPPLPSAAGRSLVGMIGGELDAGFALAEATSNSGVAIYLGQHKFIFGPAEDTPRMYDLSVDSAETLDIAANHPEAVEQARQRLEALLSDNASFAAAHPVTATDINAEDASRLRSLGYIQ